MPFLLKYEISLKFSQPPLSGKCKYVDDVKCAEELRRINMADDEIGLEDVVDLRKNPSTMAEELSEKERIRLLRNEGSDVQKKGLESIFGGNKWKPQKDRERMWAEKLDKGRKPVRELIRSHLREKGKNVPSPFDRTSNKVRDRTDKKGKSKEKKENKKELKKQSVDKGPSNSDIEPDERGMTTLDQFG